MYGKVKLTKKQIKEDKFATFLLSAKQQISDSWQYYVIGLVVVILAIAAIVFYLDMQKTESVEASALYSKGVTEYRQKNYQNALLSFQAVIDEHAGTESAKLATFLLGNTNLATQNFPEAIRYFEMYINKYSGDKLKVAASQAGLATAYENQGQYKEAADKFVEAISAAPEGPLVNDYLFSAMRDYLEIGDVSSAQTQFDKLKEKGTTTPIYKRAAILFAEKSN